MPRKNRKHRRGILYHVMGRGNGGQNIFISDDNYHYFYKLLEELHDVYDCRLHVFCLMTNHVHLVIEIDVIPLSKVMQSLFSRYAAYFNRYRKSKGHIFQGRYHALVINSDQYLRDLCCYIHRNPLRSGLVKSLDEYCWSSHQVYANKIRLNWLVTDYVLKILQHEFGVMPNLYRFFMDKVIVNPEQIKLRHELDETSSNEVLNSLRDKRNHCPYLDVTLNQIITTVCEVMRINAQDLIDVSHSPKLVEARSWVAYFGCYHARYFLQDIAAALNRERTSLTRTLHAYIKKSKQDVTLQRRLSLISSRLITLSVIKQ